MWPSFERVLTISSNSFVPLNKMAAMNKYGKTITNLLQNQESFENESWYIIIEDSSTKFVPMMDVR